MNQGLVPAKWAALTPRAEAIVDVPNSRRMTYAEFDSLVRRAANGLRGLGLQKGDRFAVLFLASDEARFVTGAALPVDAGALIR